MRFKQDSVYDFVSYKLSNPQALQQQMKMIKERQDCAKKLEDYSKQMQQLKNQHNMYKQLLEATMAKRNYLQQNYQDSKSELNQKINICKEMIEFNNRECKERQIRNENNRKDYSDFQKEIALQRDKLTIYHMNELNSLSNHCQQLKNGIEDKQQKRMKLQQQLRKLKDRQRLIQSTKQNTQIIRNKWLMKKNQFQKMKEQQSHKIKQIKDQIKHSISMQKVIYNNFYKRCVGTIQKMKEGLDMLFDIDIQETQGGNLEERMEKVLQQLKNSKQQLQKFIFEKRQQYKIGPSLPQPDAQVYNNIVQTKIIPQLLRSIDKSAYKNNIYFLQQMQNGLIDMFQKQQQQKQRCEIEINRVQQEKQGLLINLSKLESQIQAKRKQTLSPTKKNKKG